MNKKDIEQKEIEYLFQTHNELRDELKSRIAQRDNLATQYITIVGVLIGIEFTDIKYAYFCVLLIPLITLYFAVQIFSSYDVHDRLVKFIRDKIETKIGEKLNIPNDELSDYFWEQYCKVDREIHNIKMPGGRKSFFQFMVNFVPFISGIAFILLSLQKNDISKSLSYFIGFLSIIIFSIWGQYYIYRFDRKPIILEYKNKAKCDYKKKLINVRKKNKAIFLDRDGTLHVDKVETTLEKGLELFQDTKDVLKQFHSWGYLIIVVTNQSGIAKGNITYEQMHKFNKELINKCKYIDALYYCPHKKDDNCNCMKPKTGMFDRAIKELNIDISKSYMIGDQVHDMEAALNAGVPKENLFFVTTGLYKNGDYRLETNIKMYQEAIVNSLSNTVEKIEH